MQLVFDTNVLVNTLLSKGTHYKHTIELLEEVKTGNVEGWIVAHSIPEMLQILEDSLQQEIKVKKEVVRISSERVKEILSILKIIPQTGNDLKVSLEKFKYNYENFLVATIAKNYLPNPMIVSEDRSFDGGGVDVEHPDKIKSILTRSLGLHIDFANLKQQQRQIFPQLEENIHQVIKKCNFIMGEEVTKLEGKLQEFTGVKHAVSCSNGTDALLLAMMTIGIEPGDEIITTPFTFIATAETIALMKAKPIFVDIEKDTFNLAANKIEAVITEKTKAIIPVSLYGQPADIEAIQAIADAHGLKVIIDGAQSFGSTYKAKSDSNLGDISTTSFFPAKPLGCYGDGGAVFTNSDEYAEKMRMMRVHGQNKRYHHKYIGMGGRLDTLQAAILLAKLPHYKEEIKKRQDIATLYSRLLLDKSIIKPTLGNERTSVWAQYTVRIKNRSLIQEKLKNAGIPTAVHYPMPLHLQECFKSLKYEKGDFPVAELISDEVLSLPMNPFLTEKEIQYIATSLNEK